MNDLLVMGAYISSPEGEEILNESVTRLYEHFDIALVTHTPVSERIQKKVKYFIYDHRNELIQKRISTVFWGSQPKFYYEMHPDGERNYHYFAVYRSMINAIKLLSDDYSSFIYLEGDCHISPEDMTILKNFKNTAKENTKQALFFSFGDFLSTNIFYCSMDYFKSTFKILKNSSEYMERCDTIGSHGLLENYFYSSARHNGSLNDIFIIDGYINNPEKMLSTSRFDMNRNTGKAVVDPTSYTFDVLRIKDTNNLAMLYIASDGPDTLLPIKVDGEFIIDLPAKNFSTAFEISPKNENFEIDIGSNKFKFNKSKILGSQNKSFIVLK